MTMTLITGVPGAGKTLSALQMAVEARKEREVFVCGVEGLKPGEFGELDDPRDWQDCPDGSLIVVDEAWKWFGLDAQRATKLPDDDRIKALAEHRHRGMDFILTGQIPGQFCSYVKGLCGKHIHVVRKFGTTATQRFEWGAVVGSPNNATERKKGTEELWTYPKNLYDLYQSATVHTIKRKLPMKLLALPLLLLAAIALVIFGVSGFASVGDNFRLDQTEGQAANVEGASATERRSLPAGRTQGRRADEPKYPNAMSYVQAHLPRVPGMPGSAPIFDDRKPKSEPRMYCIIVGDRCGCYTEQVTRLTIDPLMCRDVAVNGMYDPYRPPYEAQERKTTLASITREARERERRQPRVGNNYTPPTDTAAPSMWGDRETMFPEHRRNR
ncbi:MAG: hypothetical protein KDI75_10010 [Xanthomonadales bacterium]|nr:hypothetical protein [Xanthomonadales bacterium]